MIFGIPREVKPDEYRVGAMPFLVKELTKRNHQVYVETGAGDYCNASDSSYEHAGAKILPSPEKLYASVDAILKVREPQPVEYDLISPDQIIFAFFHFVRNPELVKTMAARGSTSFAYEFVEDDNGEHPISRPISRITGQMATLNGAFYLQKHAGGRGIVLGQVTGSPTAQVTILGAGNVGQQAAITAAKLGAQVTVLDTNFEKLQQLDAFNLHNVSTLILTEEFLKEILPQTDLLISCIQVADRKTPRLITPEMVKTMRSGSVIVDVDIDLGGSVETCKATTLENPVFILHDVVHYCVSNITSAVPRIASRALSAAIMPYLLRIAEEGLENAVLNDPYLAKGLAVYKGYVVKKTLAEIANLPVADLKQKIKDLNPGENE